MEQRLQRLEAESEIRGLLVDYATYLDARDYKAYTGLFTEDGEWTGGLGSFKSPAAIEQMLLDNVGIYEPGYVNASNFHTLANPHVEVDGDSATVTSMFLFWVRSGGESPMPQPVLAGRYVDEFVKLDGEWKVAKRTAYNLIPFKDPHNPDAPDPGLTSAAAPVVPNSLEARLKKVEDELAIRRIMIEYSARLDGKDIDAWVDVFAKNGTWENGDQIHTGPEELHTLLLHLFGGEPSVDYMQGESYQIIHGPQIDVDGDTAKVRSRHTLLQRDETGAPKPVLAGIYVDDFIREDGEWKILYRKDYPVIPTRDEWEAILEAERSV